MRNIYTQMDKKDPLLVLSDKSVSQAPAAHVIAVLEVKHVSQQITRAGKKAHLEVQVMPNSLGFSNCKLSMRYLVLHIQRIVFI